MKKPTIPVTGATGLTGSAVVSQLRAKDYPVRAVVHSTDRRSDQSRQIGATVREFARFMSVAFRPGLNPTRFTSEHMLPEPHTPTQVMRSKQWQEERASIFSATTHAIQSVAHGQV